MERPTLDMGSLFDQLGEPSDSASIARFIERHAPLADAVQLHEATFWSPTQSAFLREALLDDAEWAEVVDALNGELHARH